jgi:predicted Fe-Mo cluster-binding NifX family protein
LDQFDVAAVDAVVCRGIGRNALLGLEGAGIPVYLVSCGTVAEVMVAARTGAWQRMTLERTCAGHGETGAAGHGHRGGCCGG